MYQPVPDSSGSKTCCYVLVAANILAWGYVLYQYLDSLNSTPPMMPGRPYITAGQTLVATCTAAEVLRNTTTRAACSAWGSAKSSFGLQDKCAVHAPSKDFAARLVEEALRGAGTDAAAKALDVKGTLELEPELATLLGGARAEVANMEPADLEEWQGEGLAEHASIGTFAKLCLELLVAGAPPHLTRQAIRAQEEEAMHAHITLALSSAKNEKQEGMALEFPEHTVAFRRDHSALHSAAAREGLEGEGHAALKLFGKAAAALEPAAHRPALAKLLWAMAQDEARHAALAADTLAWLHQVWGMPYPDVEIYDGQVKVRWPQVV